jgi:hypothetical protein
MNVLNMINMRIVGIAVLLNLLLPFLLKPLANEEEVSPPNGAASLSMKGQLMHMFVHHAQVPISSSVIVAVIIIVALLADKMLL